MSSEPSDDHVDHRMSIAAGVLMQQGDCDAPAAYERLRRLSVRGGKNLHDTADVVIASAEMGCSLDCSGS